jgi:hypothetical protein
MLIDYFEVYFFSLGASTILGIDGYIIDVSTMNNLN